MSGVLLVAVCLSISGCGKFEPQGQPAATQEQSGSTGADKPTAESPKKRKLASEDALQRKPIVTLEPAEKSVPQTELGVQRPIAVDQVVDVQKIYRPSDSRPAYDDADLGKRGFTKITGQRLILYSDLPAKDLVGLPEMAEQLYPTLEGFFGPLPPDREGRPYQMTAFLMSEPQRFLDAKLINESRVQPHEGWYRGSEFWWNLQPSAYYTRHLLLHEATHCFMHVMPPVDCPPWYVEGMAEVFGTHATDAAGKLQLGVMPARPEDFSGWARISVIQDEVKAGRLLDVDQILALRFNDFQKLPAYAWSWALCHYLNNHPRYQKPFRELAKRVFDGGFQKQFADLFARDMPDLKDEWLLYASQLQYGHDIVHGKMEFSPGLEVDKEQPAKAVAIFAQRGWQSAGAKVIAGKTYHIRASGRITLAETSKPWISEPQGISIRYFSGQALGRLIGCIRPEPLDGRNRGILKLIPFGPDEVFIASHSGTLFLRCNDAWNELQDNTGEFQVQIKAK